MAKKTFDISFKDIEWGEDEAKGDSSLEHYFVEFPGYDKIWSGKKRYIIGRKGTGKSAILQKIRLTAQSDPKIFHTEISLRDFPLSDFKSMGDRSLQDKSKYVSAWKFLLLTEIAKMMTDDNSINSDYAVRRLRKFLDENFPDGVSVIESISKLKQRHNKVSILTSPFSAEHSSDITTEKNALVHYNQAVKELEKLFQEVETDSQYILLIDELDEGFKIKNSNLNMVILSLLRATDELFKFFKDAGLNCIPVLALRSDIFNSLEDNDLNKLDDYVLRLNWTTNEEDPWSLKQIVEKRIEATVKEKFPTLDITNYWSLVADNDSTKYGLWKYICTLTHSRPRDIIKLLKRCSDVVRGNKLMIEDVHKAEAAYSAWFYNEFRDEVQSFLPCWKEALNCITEVAQGKEKTPVLLKRFDANEAIAAWCAENKKTSIDVLKIYFSYSVIGCVNSNGRWIFRYKDDTLEYMPSYPYYCVHYGFCRKLRITKSYDDTIVKELL